MPNFLDTIAPFLPQTGRSRREQQFQHSNSLLNNEATLRRMEADRAEAAKLTTAKALQDLELAKMGKVQAFEDNLFRQSMPAEWTEEQRAAELGRIRVNVDRAKAAEAGNKLKAAETIAPLVSRQTTAQFDSDMASLLQKTAEGTLAGERADAQRPFVPQLALSGAQRQRAVDTTARVKAEDEFNLAPMEAAARSSRLTMGMGQDEQMRKYFAASDPALRARAEAATFGTTAKVQELIGENPEAFSREIAPQGLTAPQVSALRVLADAYTDSGKPVPPEIMEMLGNAVQGTRQAPATAPRGGGGAPDFSSW